MGPVSSTDRFLLWCAGIDLLSSGILSGSGLSGRKRYWSCWQSQAHFAERVPRGRAVWCWVSRDNRYSACEVLSLIAIGVLRWAAAASPHSIKWRCWGVSESPKPLTLLKGNKGQMDLLIFLLFLIPYPHPQKKAPSTLLHTPPCSCPPFGDLTDAWVSWSELTEHSRQGSLHMCKAACYGLDCVCQKGVEVLTPTTCQYDFMWR